MIYGIFFNMGFGHHGAMMLNTNQLIRSFINFLLQIVVQEFVAIIDTDFFLSAELGVCFWG